MTRPAYAYTADRIIYIRSGGSVDPEIPAIVRTGDVYTFTDDISSNFINAIIIEKNDIVLDGAGFSLHGNMVSASNGIKLLNRNNVTIKNLSIDSFYNGIYLFTSQNNIIIGNRITGNREAGIYLYYSSFNNITRNKITDTPTPNFGGIRLNSANYNSITCNNITSNYFGIYFLDSQGNQIFHNNLISNTLNAYGTWDLGFPSPGNTWDNGYPSGGNYWSDYNGNDANNDGIGDTPYAIDATNIDHYPLMNPCGTYCLKIEVNVSPGGTTNPSPGTYHCETGTQVEVTATPNPGFMFAYWKLGSKNVNDNPTKVLVNCDITLEAVFAPTQVVPVVPFGIIGALLAMIFTLVGFAGFKRTRQTKNA
jgi:parallel beta-helix repeat protein